MSDQCEPGPSTLTTSAWRRTSTSPCSTALPRWGSAVTLHHGEVLTREWEGDPTPVISGGDAILCATRVEPHVQPGQIWATEDFRQQLCERPSLWRATPVTGPDGSDRFNVKKAGGTEPDLWVRLYRLEL